MAITRTNSFEGGTNGTTLSTANTGGASGNAFDAVTITGTGATATFSTTSPYKGSLCGAIASGTSTSGIKALVRYSPAGGIGTSAQFRAYINLTGLPSSSSQVLQIANSTGVIADVFINATGTIGVQASGTTIGTTTTALVANTWYRLEAWLTPGATTTTGALHVGIATGDAALTETVDSTTCNLSTTQAVTQFSLGALSGNFNSATLSIDDLALGNSAAFIGASVIQSSTVTAAATAGATLTGPVTETTTVTATSTATAALTTTLSKFATVTAATTATATVAAGIGQAVTANTTTTATLAGTISRVAAIGIVARGVGGVFGMLTRRIPMTADGHAALTLFGITGRLGAVTFTSGGSALQFLPAGFGVTPFGNFSFGGVLISALVWQYTATGWQQLTTFKRWNESSQAWETTTINAY